MILMNNWISFYVIISQRVYIIYYKIYVNFTYGKGLIEYGL